MSKSVLIESRMNSLKLCESDSKTVRKGCLGRMEGICADFANPTRNNRFYSRELWENVFNNDLVKESLECKTLIGELDHPEDRFEPLAQEACVVLTDYHFDDADQTLKCGFDILDTQKGRLLKSLLDYGCVMGVSSRGQGDTINNGEYEEVDPDTYDFACFDVVLTPAVETARQTVVESKGKTNTKLVSLTESISNEIKSATTLNELNNIKAIVESSKIPNAKSLLSKIEKCCKSLEQGKTISPTLKEDLHRAKIRINKLERALESKSNETIIEQKKSNETISGLTTKILAYQHRESRLSDSIKSITKENVRLKKLIADKDTEIKRKENLIHKYQVKEAKGKDAVSKMTVSTNELSEQLAQANRELDKLSKTETVIQNKLNAKISDLSESKQTISELRKQLADANKQNTKLNEKLNSVTSDYDNQITMLKSDISSLKNTHKSDVAKLSKDLKESKDRYISITAKQYGIPETNLTSIITESMSLNEVDAVIKSERDRLDRYTNLPFSVNSAKPSVIVENRSIRKHPEDNEYEQSEKFLSLVAGIENTN